MHLFERSLVVCLLFLSASHARGEEAISPFLTHMPQNSDKRCVGIAGVAEALLEGQQVADLKSSAEKLAREIYQDFTSEKLVRYPSHIDVDDRHLSIDDREALAALSTRVAELYKADFRRLSDTPSGIDRLSAAQQNVVRSGAELDGLLKSDPDQTVFFCCFGKRTFPSGKVNETSHAVLIQLSTDGYSIYDPNDPGAAIECEVAETPKGLTLTWKCQYRDKKIETTQQYLVVPQARYFNSLQ